MGIQTGQPRGLAADLALEVVQTNAPGPREQQPAGALPEDEAALGTFVQLFLSGLLGDLLGHGQPGDNTLRHPGLVIHHGQQDQQPQHHVALHGHEQQHGGHDQVGLA